MFDDYEFAFCAQNTLKNLNALMLIRNIIYLLYYFSSKRTRIISLVSV